MKASSELLFHESVVKNAADYKDYLWICKQHHLSTHSEGVFNLRRQSAEDITDAITKSMLGNARIKP